jgi:hypothetical protein
MIDNGGEMFIMRGSLRVSTKTTEVLGKAEPFVAGRHSNNVVSPRAQEPSCMYGQAHHVGDRWLDWSVKK